MSVIHLATNQLVITRLTTVSGHIKAYATTTGIKANLQPLSAQKTALFDGVMGKTYTIYADGTLDVVEGDRFRDTSTQDIYQVKNGGVSRRTMGAIDYLEVIVEKIN